MDAAQKTSRSQALLIGTVHFANPGLDRFNVEVDDVLAPERQAEIDEVVEGLATFRPTRVAVEELSSSDVLSRYESFLGGNYALRRNETEQIGFRLARRTGASLALIDVQAEFYVREIERLVTQEPHRTAWEKMEDVGREAAAATQRWLATRTIGQILYKLNTPDELERVAASYRALLRIASAENDAGPRMVANWYARNIRILANLLRASEPGDRMLVLIGQGHVPILRDLMRDLADLEIVRPERYLMPTLADIATEIVGMAKIDQEMRRTAMSQRAGWDPTVDERNTSRLKEIVEAIGWPTRSKVGEAAEHDAWLLTQHADGDRSFQRSCLELMKRERSDEVCRQHIAYLEDRVRIADGLPQLYGTQLRRVNDSALEPLPIEDPDHVDERRAAFGLGPLRDYVAPARVRPP